MQMWPGHHMEHHEFNMHDAASRMANMFNSHVPLAMSLCRVDYSNLKLQQAAALSSHMYTPATGAAFEGLVYLFIYFISIRHKHRHKMGN